jgi:hypothetical protein
MMDAELRVFRKQRPGRTKLCGDLSTTKGSKGSSKKFKRVGYAASRKCCVLSLRIENRKPKIDLHCTWCSNAQGSTIGKMFPGGNTRSSVGRGARDVEMHPSYPFGHHTTQQGRSRCEAKRAAPKEHCSAVIHLRSDTSCSSSFLSSILSFFFGD